MGEYFEHKWMDEQINPLHFKVMLMNFNKLDSHWCRVSNCVSYRLCDVIKHLQLGRVVFSQPMRRQLFTCLYVKLKYWFDNVQRVLLLFSKYATCYTMNSIQQCYSIFVSGNIHVVLAVLKRY